MAKTLSLLFLCLFFIACNKSGDEATDCSSSIEAQEDTSSTGCTIIDGPATGEAGGTEGGTTGGTAGGSVGGTSGGTTGGTTGSTTGGTTGGTSGGASLPNEAYTFDHSITFYNTSLAQEEKFQKALEIIQKVVATEEFRTRILNHTYNGKKTFVDNDGFTNAQIYQKILDGAETLQPAKNNIMNMEVEVYYANNSTVGYTYPSSKRIWVNTKFFNSYTAAGVARNLFHEWLHKVGFSHATSWSTSRDYSVPYAIGDIVQDLGEKFL